MSDLISRRALLDAMPKNNELLSLDVRRVICDAPAMDTMPRWISVEESLPEKGVFVVVYYGHFIGNLMDVYMWDGECWRSSTGYLEDAENITHWMPLPEPPKEAT